MKQSVKNFLSEDTFWEIIEKSLKNSNNKKFPSLEEQEEFLSELIQELTEEEIFGYQYNFQNFMNLSYRQDLWCVAYIVMGGCSDDGFMDFRAWLITRGKEIFFRELQNPDSLSKEFEKIYDGDIPSWETVAYLPKIVFEEKFEKDFYKEESNYNLELKDIPRLQFEWNENDQESLRKICPKVYDNWNENDIF